MLLNLLAELQVKGKLPLKEKKKTGLHIYRTEADSPL